MVRAIEGIYRNGKVELTETPADVESARVYVLFVGENHSAGEASSRRHLAINALLEEMKTGQDLGGPPYLRRDEIYERGADK